MILCTGTGIESELGVLDAGSGHKDEILEYRCVLSLRGSRIGALILSLLR
jgi:hypothetical protein